MRHEGRFGFTIAAFLGYVWLILGERGREREGGGGNQGRVRELEGRRGCERVA
jgi:hypothetical protein